MSALSELREALEYAGLKSESAERIAYTLQSREFMRIDLATKEDIYKVESRIQEVKSELKEEINQLDKKIDIVKSELKEEIQDVKKETLLLRQEITKQENKILWFFASGIGLVIISQILLSFLK